MPPRSLGSFGGPDCTTTPEFILAERSQAGQLSLLLQRRSKRKGTAAPDWPKVARPGDNEDGGRKSAASGCSFPLSLARWRHIIHDLPLRKALAGGCPEGRRDSGALAGRVESRARLQGHYSAPTVTKELRPSGEACGDSAPSSHGRRSVLHTKEQSLCW